MTDTQIAQLFRYKWGREGGMHWVYNTMRECVDVWRKWGIVGIPNWTEGAETLLADDIARDDQFHAMLSARLGA